MSQQPLVITIHGWNSGGQYMKYFNPHFAAAGFPVFNYEYGWMLAASLRNRNIARRIVAFGRFAQQICGHRELVLVGHSNGCVLAYYAAWMCEAVRGLVLVNAALDHDVEFPPHVGWAHNWYSPGDWAVRLARLIPFHAWGGLGARPYDGVSPQVRNFNKAEDFELSSNRHSDIFHRGLRDYFMPLIVERVKYAIVAGRPDLD